MNQEAWIYLVYYQFSCASLEVIRKLLCFVEVIHMLMCLLKIKQSCARFYLVALTGLFWYGLMILEIRKKIASLG